MLDSAKLGCDRSAKTIPCTGQWTPTRLSKHCHWYREMEPKGDILQDRAQGSHICKRSSEANRCPSLEKFQDIDIKDASLSLPHGALSINGE